MTLNPKAVAAIRAELDRRMWQQQELARRAGVGDATVSVFLRSGVIGPKALRRICKALTFSAEEIEAATSRKAKAASR